MDIICAKCNTHLEKSTDLLINGCNKCGSKVFKTETSSLTDKSEIRITIPKALRENLDEFSTTSFEIVPKIIPQEKIAKKEDEKDNLDEDNIPAIKLKKKGVYEVNLESLFRDKKSDPIILSGKSGVYRVELLPTTAKKD